VVVGSTHRHHVAAAAAALEVRTKTFELANRQTHLKSSICRFRFERSTSSQPSGHRIMKGSLARQHYGSMVDVRGKNNANEGKVTSEQQAYVPVRYVSRVENEKHQATSGKVRHAVSNHGTARVNTARGKDDAARHDGADEHAGTRERPEAEHIPVTAFSDGRDGARHIRRPVAQGQQCHPREARR
jgi:hypothetical protein